MLKGKLRKGLIVAGLLSITFVGTALAYYANNFQQHGFIKFDSSNSSSISVLFCMIFFIMAVCVYLIAENRSLIKQNQQLLYKLLEQNEVHYDQLQKSNMNTREILLERTNNI